MSVLSRKMFKFAACFTLRHLHIVKKRFHIFPFAETSTISLKRGSMEGVRSFFGSIYISKQDYNGSKWSAVIIR